MKISLFPEDTQRIVHPTAEDVPAYYSRALRSAHLLMTLYFLCFFIYIVPFPELREKCMFVIIWLLAGALLTYFNDAIPIRWNLFWLVVMNVSWVVIFVVRYGWDCGVQHFIIPLMIVSLFSIYDSMAQKLGFCAVLFLLRMGLFSYCMYHEPYVTLETSVATAFQVFSTSFMFFLVGYVCMIFSTNIQKSEKQLLVDNQKLQEEAVTDPLTGLYNRRHMLKVLEENIKSNPDTGFCVAMGDIDWFKNVNDTYGHNFGDVVLKTLAALFTEKLAGRGEVCRWGGEEFFFYMPEMNLDEASIVICDLNIAVSQLQIQDKDITAQVTMTFGVEDYDFHSDIKGLVKRADDKLYYGKEHGRNRVIV